MIIDCIADLHGEQPELSGGDLLIIAGDLTGRDFETEHALFDYWINEQKYKKKIVIAGNHDNVLFENRLKFQFCEYLCDSGTEFEGLKIWGTPWSLTFEGINPHCTAFTGTETDLKKKYDLIPNNIDILISHGPPSGILDRTKKGQHVGSYELLSAMFRIKPKLLIFGHIHEFGGKSIDLTTTICVNCSHINEDYEPTYKPVRIIL